MKKALIILLIVANFVWAIVFSVTVISQHTDKWYLQLILLYPLILIMSFSLKYLNDSSEKYGHYMSVALYSLTMIIAIGFIFTYV